MHAELPQQNAYIGRVRAKVWAVLAATLLLALLLPLLILWHTSALPLRAQACVSPRIPRAGTSAYLVVALADPTDRTAVEGPWAQVQVKRDMTTMAMREPPVVAHGLSQGSGDTATFAVPLRLDMAGPWRIEVTLQTPGRPAWQSVVWVTVLPPLAGTTTSADAGASSRGVYQAPCISSSANSS